MVAVVAVDVEDLGMPWRERERGVAIADREGEQALKIVIVWKRIQRRDSTLSWTSSLTLLRNPSPIPVHQYHVELYKYHHHQEAKNETIMSLH